MKKEDLSGRGIDKIKTSDAKLFLIKLQQDGKSYSTIHTIRGVLRPAFQMAMDDDILYKNPFSFELADVVVNDSVRREAITAKEMRNFLNFRKTEGRCFCLAWQTKAASPCLPLVFTKSQPTKLMLQNLALEISKYNG